MSPKVSVVIPVFNEIETINELYKRLAKTLEKAGFTYELIFVDDHSTDGTPEFVRKLKKRNVRVISKKGSKGKAFSLTEGFAKAKGKYLVMIDADLQYPPEEIPAIVSKLDGADVVVANRREYKGGKLRKFLSRSFRTVFGKLAFGIDVDIQSGLKAFSRDVYEDLHFVPKSPWVFDLEFLHRATQMGYKVDGHDISFEERPRGNSKIDVLGTSFEIGLNAFNLKLRASDPIKIAPKNGSMEGAGVGFRKSRYITHTTLDHRKSALKTFTPSIKAGIVLILFFIVIGFAIDPLGAAMVLVGFLSLVYFLDVLFNFYIIQKSLRQTREISFNEKEVANLTDKELPVYTILCPLYREAHVVPQFVSAISALDYPKKKLEVMLLLEEDDLETIDEIKKMALPSFVKTVVVPHSNPKTKPKACNYGLAKATGDFLVIYDAEDIPDPEQLKKAYLGFKTLPKDVICLQAKLNYYNPKQNLLTRFFTAEYSLWFDVVLTGLQSLNTSLPLGGTSNHFRTSDLRKLEGWDPFNVTEDADLGIRLFDIGYKTAMIDSTTLEEANSDVKNWVRQRSRWIKGYMQTYLVHMRNILGFTKRNKQHALVFHLIMGGKIAFIFINPFLWMATISYFALYSIVGPSIEALYPPVIFYMAVASLVFGNFLFAFYYMIGLYKRGQYDLIKYIYLIPLYWLLLSVAGAIALYQLIFKPHYWEKTIHGLHLKKVKEDVEKIVEHEIFPAGNVTSSKKRFSTPAWVTALNPVTMVSHILNSSKRKSLGNMYAGIFLVAAAVVSNFLNFLTSAYLGRTLGFEEFALISLLGSFLFIVQIPSSGIGQTTAHQTAFLLGKYGALPGQLWEKYKSRFVAISIVLTLIWILLVPFLEGFFNSHTIIPFLVFTPMWIILIVAAVSDGFLMGGLRFKFLAFLLILEAVLKLVLSFIFVEFGFGDLVYTALPLSLFAGFIGSFLYAKRLADKASKSTKSPEFKQNDLIFSKKFFSVSMLTKVSSVSFLSLDLVLAKHYLTAIEAGQYALLILVGRMIYMVGGLSSQFILPLISKESGEGKKDSKTYGWLFLSLLATTSLAFIFVGPLGSFTMPVLFGEKVDPIISYLTPFGLSMVLFSLAYSIAMYHQARREYLFVLPGILTVVVQFVSLYFFHQSIWQVVAVMLFSGLFFFVTAGTLHLFYKPVKKGLTNLEKLFGSAIAGFRAEKNSSDKYSILIFNWRDTKHVWSGGAEVYVHEIAKRWVSSGYNVTVFCGNDRRSAGDQVMDGVSILRRGGAYTVYFWAFFYYIFKLRGKYDVIIDCENGIPFFTPLYVRKPVYLLIHHVHQEVFREHLIFPLSVFARFLEARLMPLIYRNKQVITVSESSKQAIIKTGIMKEENISIVPNGVDLEKYSLRRKAPFPLFTYLGRLKAYKNVDVALRAFAVVVKKHPKAIFAVVGSGEMEDKLKKIVSKQGIKKNVVFCGQVPEVQKAEILAKSWVCIQPSMMEGWGLTVIEANASGTPVIASDVPGLRDAVVHDKTGILVPVKNVEALADAMIWALENPKELGGMMISSREWATKFEWDTSADILLSIIKTKEKKESPAFSKKFASVFNRIQSLF